MKHIQHPWLWKTLAVSLLAGHLQKPQVLAQTSTMAEATAESNLITMISDEDVVELSPFEVSTTQEGVYRERMAITASGISAPIRETPLSISVINSELLKDLANVELNDAFRYEAGISVNPDSVLRPEADLKIRGFDVGWILRNGFRRYYFQNIDGVDRIEIVRGPVGAFYGQAQPGGVVNYITKKPENNFKHSVRFTYGSYDFYKIITDTTGPIVKDLVSYRLIATYQNSNSWKQYVSNERPYLLSAIRVKPYSKLTFDFDYEYTLNRQKGAVRTALVQQTDYVKDYELFQKRAADEKWYLQVNTNTKGSYFPYNVNYFTRYPINYQKAYIDAGIKSGSLYPTNFFRNNPWMATDIHVPAGRVLQYPIIEKDSALGNYSNGVVINQKLATNNRTSYRYGWRTLKMLSQFGAYDFATGQFHPVDFKNINPNIDVVPSLNAIVFPKGASFNPNGPGAWYFDESHNATADIKLKATDWLNVRYAINYLELQNRQVQQYNSDTDMDGFTLNAGQGFPSIKGQTTSGATGFFNYNRYWVHQASANLKFDTASVKHNLLLIGEYRDDQYLQFQPTGTDYWFENGGRNSPGFALWDIFNDPAPDTALWATNDPEMSFTQGNATLQEGYSASYRMLIWDERIQLWAGIRHERSDNCGIRQVTVKDAVTNEDRTYIEETGDRAISKATTPMYGVSVQAFKGINFYANYSESVISRQASENNVAYYDISKPLRADITNWINDGFPLNSIPQNVTLKDFEFLPSNTVGNPQGIGYEAGIKFELFERWGVLSGSTAIFHLEREDLLTRQTSYLAQVNELYNLMLKNGLVISDAPSYTLPSSVYQNAGKDEVEGIEIAFNYIPPLEEQNLQINLSFAYFMKAKAKEIGDVDLYGDPSLAPDSGNDAPIGNPSLFYWDTTTNTPLPKVPANHDGIQEVYEKRDLKVAENELPSWYYPEVYLPKLNNRLNNIPDIQLSMQARYDFKTGYLAGARVIFAYSYESESPGSINSPAAESRITTKRNPAAHLFEFGLGYLWKLPRDTALDISVNIKNVFDQQYTKSSFGLLDPRIIYLNLEYKF